jgi:pimeloyl-ACP methyl ester carboxylesterase
MECELDGIKVHYESCGDGRPIVALHGWVDADALVQPCPAPVGTFAALDRSGHFMGTLRVAAHPQYVSRPQPTRQRRT